MKVVTIKFGGPRELKEHNIRFSLGAWFSCDEQKDCQESNFRKN